MIIGAIQISDAIVADRKRIADLERSVHNLAEIVEMLVIGNKALTQQGRADYLSAVDTVRALATPETADEPDPSAIALAPLKLKPNAQPLPRFQIDCPDGDAVQTDDIERVLEAVERRAAVHVYDRRDCLMLVHNFREKAAYVDLIEEYRAINAQATA